MYQVLPVVTFFFGGGLFKVTFSRVKMVNSDLHLGDQRVTWKKAGIITCNCFVDEAI